VQDWRAGPLFDVWYGNYEDIGEKIERQVG
jgi:hypothetical protein